MIWLRKQGKYMTGEQLKKRPDDDEKGKTSILSVPATILPKEEKLELWRQSWIFM